MKLLLTGFVLIMLSSCQSGTSTKETTTDSSNQTKDSAMTSEKMQAINTLSDQEKNDGWQLLFDGQTTKGWHSYGKPTAGSAWKVRDGSIYLDTTLKDGWQVKDGGDMTTDNEFSNFDLKLEWNISKNGNSGIIFYVHEDTTTYKQTWHTGLEMQVLDNGGHPDAKIPKHRAGDLYDLISGSPETVKPPGEWNQVEIIADNGQLEFHLNGQKVLSTLLWDDNWKNLVAKSKFKDMPGFSKFKTGKIALQDHGNEVWYRNIKVKKL